MKAYPSSLLALHVDETDDDEAKRVETDDDT